MCRNIKILFNFDPPVNAEEIRAASLQFVRKITGFNKPSKANEASFLAAVDEVAAVSARRRIARKKRPRRKLALRKDSAFRRRSRQRLQILEDSVQVVEIICKLFDIILEI